MIASGRPCVDAVPMLGAKEVDMAQITKALVIARLWTDTRGQDLVEYALMAGFITVAIGAAFPPVSSSISTIFSRVGSLLSQA
jgi:Flp pilus assembly pilin Flp